MLWRGVGVRKQRPGHFERKNRFLSLPQWTNVQSLLQVTEMVSKREGTKFPSQVKVGICFISSYNQIIERNN